jgi:hypothetical protein
MPNRISDHLVKTNTRCNITTGADQAERIIKYVTQVTLIGLILAAVVVQGWLISTGGTPLETTSVQYANGGNE